MELYIAIIDPDVDINLPLADHQCFDSVVRYGLRCYDLGGDDHLTDEQIKYLDTCTNVASYAVHPIDWE